MSIVTATAPFAEVGAARRPSVTFASFSREGTK